MIIALIKENIVINTVIFKTVDDAINMLSSEYDEIVECPLDRGISHKKKYGEDKWFDPQPLQDEDGIYPFIAGITLKKGEKERYEDKIYIAKEYIYLQEVPPTELYEKFEEII